jgi:O-antigen ligase
LEGPVYSPEKSLWTNLPLTLMRVGAGLVGLAAIVSMWATPDWRRSLPWFVITVAGVVMVLIVTGGWLPFLARKVSRSALVRFFLAANFTALLVALFTSNWLSYKYPWLSRLYSVLPSIHASPFSWARPGLPANQTGGMLAVLTTFSLAMALAPAPPAEVRGGKQTLHRWMAVFLAFAGAVVVFMTGSRAALAGLVIAMVLILIVRNLRWIWVWASGFVLTLGGLAIAGRLGWVLQLLVSDQTLSSKLVSRLDIWSSAWMGIQDHLVTGIGLGVFDQVMPARYPYGAVSLSFSVVQAHNLFLDVALSIGLPGLLGLLLLLAGLGKLAIDGMKGDYSTRIVALGIIASVVAFLVFGIGDSMGFSRPTSFVLWIWACAVALNRARPRSGPAPSGSDLEDQSSDHIASLGPYNGLP